jgi:hypothetical protein
MMPGPVNTAGCSSFHTIACEDFSNLLLSGRASIVRVDMESSIRSPDLTSSPSGEWIKDMRNVIVRVKFHSLGKCDNPVETRTIRGDCHHHFSRLNCDSLPFGASVPSGSQIRS